jgi:hypothetical protein
VLADGFYILIISALSIILLLKSLSKLVSNRVVEVLIPRKVMELHQANEIAILLALSSCIAYNETHIRVTLREL